MTKLRFTPIIFSLIFFACAQNTTSRQATPAKQDTIINQQLIFDTITIAILPIDTTYRWLFKDATSLQLTNEDLHSIDALLNACIKVHNSNQDSTNEYSEFIDLKEYQRQYVPFVDSKGDKKVYVNCFCSHDIPNEFDYWKKALVEVDDGGSCFFHLTLNLSTNKYEQLFTNGYA
jgi:hypothetical protein